MWYVGIDFHWKQTTFCVLDQYGRKVKTATRKTGWKTAIGDLRRLGRRFAVCFEASTGYGFLFDELAKIAEFVKVAHPGQLRLIFRSKRKSDRVDAEKLAKLLYLGEVPDVHVPESEVRAWRRAINYRHRTVCERTGAKNAIRALLRGLGIEAPRSLWTRAGRRWLKDLEFASELDGLGRDTLLERVEWLTGVVKRVEKVLNAIAKKNPGVQLLMTIPGVGVRTAEAVIAWIDKPSRFGNIKAVPCYFGMVPSQDQSANANRLGHITKEGPAVVRKLIVEASWQSVRRSPRTRAYYERIRRDDTDRKKIAIVATGNYLLRVMASMLKTGEVWRDEAAA